MPKPDERLRLSAVDNKKPKSNSVQTRKNVEGKLRLRNVGETKRNVVYKKLLHASAIPHCVELRPRWRNVRKTRSGTGWNLKGNWPGRKHSAKRHWSKSLNSQSDSGRFCSSAPLLQRYRPSSFGCTSRSTPLLRRNITQATFSL